MRLGPFCAVAVLALAAAAAAPAADRSYLVLGKAGTAASKLAADVAKAGGTVVRAIPEVGIVVATSPSASFAAKASTLASVQSVAPNLRINWLPKETTVPGEEFSNPPNSGDNDTRFDLQWGHDAVDAIEAWNAGYRGAGVTVAVLDSGIACTHPDIAPNLLASASVSFVPSESVCVQPGFYFNHGTHVAGTIAAADNGTGIIGVAPEAKLIAVKVLSEFSGSGDFDWLISGIVYAANKGANVINMSLGGYIAKSGACDEDGCYSAKEAAELKNAIARATTYAYQKGVTIIAAAGNESIDFDHTANWIHLPGDAPHVLSISATAPIGWAKGGNPILDYPTSYTNYGQSAISFAAPGGDTAYPGNESCTVGGLTRPCWVFDLVFSDIPGGYGWAGGTSMAAPHVSGVAAIIIGKNGGSMAPAQVAAALAQSADDLGKPGNDDFYGAGRVNAGNAVQ